MAISCVVSCHHVGVNVVMEYMDITIDHMNSSLLSDGWFIVNFPVFLNVFVFTFKTYSEVILEHVVMIASSLQ